MLNVPGTPYTIQPGDNFWRLAQRYGTTPADIGAANPGIDPYDLRVGQVITIPAGPFRPPPSPPCPPGMLPYSIQPGDTIGDIAWRHGMSVDVLLRYNPHVDPYNLRVGSSICIP